MLRTSLARSLTLQCTVGDELIKLSLIIRNTLAGKEHSIAGLLWSLLVLAFLVY